MATLTDEQKELLQARRGALQLEEHRRKEDKELQELMKARSSRQEELKELLQKSRQEFMGIRKALQANKIQKMEIQLEMGEAGNPADKYLEKFIDKDLQLEAITGKK